MLRAIREIAPRWIVGENVRGLTNWNGGMVFEEVCADLENLGYKVTAFLIPACATNAPHKRERIWIVAYSECFRFKCGEQQKQSRCEEMLFEGFCFNGDAADTDCERMEGEATNRIMERERPFISNFQNGRYWQDFPTVSPVCVRDDGFPDRLDGITFPKWRNESIKAGGNAVVPQVVYQIFKAIEQYDNDVRQDRQ